MLGKVSMRLDRVSGNADYFRAGGEIVFPTITQGTHLLGANRRFVARVEEQHDHLAALLRESPGLARAIGEREVGRNRSCFCVGLCQSYLTTDAKPAAANCVRISSS